MNYATLTTAFQNVNGSSFVGIDTLTQVKLTGGKKNPQQGRITKKMTGARVMVFQNKNINGYTAMIERRLISEGKDPASFELGERAWGSRISNTPFVEHTKDGVVQHYLEVIFLSTGTVAYFQDGVSIDVSDITGLDVNTQEGDQGGLTNKVIVRSFKADSITEVRVDGKVFN